MTCFTQYEAGITMSKTRSKSIKIMESWDKNNSLDDHLKSQFIKILFKKLDDLLEDNPYLVSINGNYVIDDVNQHSDTFYAMVNSRFMIEIDFQEIQEYAEKRDSSYDVTSQQDNEWITFSKIDKLVLSKKLQLVMDEIIGTTRRIEDQQRAEQDRLKYEEYKRYTALPRDADRVDKPYNIYLKSNLFPSVFIDPVSQKIKLEDQRKKQMKRN